MSSGEAEADGVSHDALAEDAWTVSPLGERRTCFVLQDDYSRLVDAEHVVDNVLAAHVGQI